MDHRDERFLAYRAAPTARFAYERAPLISARDQAVLDEGGELENNLVEVVIFVTIGFRLLGRRLEDPKPTKTIALSME